MSKVTMTAAIVLLVASTGLGAYVDYQGAGGNLAVAGDWYVITTAGDPASRTGVTRLPVMGGAVGSNNMGDDAFVRNGTTTTLSTTLGAGRLRLGGGTVTVTPPGSAPTVYLANGGTISIMSDGGLDTQGGRLRIGDTYGATLNQQPGSFIYTTGRIDSGITISTGGVYNMSGGSVKINDPMAGVPLFTVGNTSSGTLNQSGGMIQIGGNNPATDRVSDKAFEIGRGAYGEYNLSGGSINCLSWSQLGTTYTDDGGTAHAGTGVVNQTGGTFSGYSYRLTIADNFLGAGNIGHYRLLGGTFDCPGHIHLSREQATPVDGTGKLTINQSAKMIIKGLVSGGAYYSVTPTATSSQVELKINSTNNFDWTCTEVCTWRGGVEVSFTDGFTPTVGSEWKVMDIPANIQPEVWVTLAGITPGFRLEKRGGAFDGTTYAARSIWLICDALRRPGDANNDGFVDVGDLGILAFNWGQTTVLGKSWTEADFTGDDIVDVGDLGVLAFNWGWIGTPVDAGSAVPEPASLTLLVLGAAALIRRRHRVWN